MWEKASLSPKHVIPVRWEHCAATAYVFQKANLPPWHVRVGYSQKNTAVTEVTEATSKRS